MEISEERLLLFIKLYKEEFGVELSHSQAHEKASLLLNYATLCIKPLALVDKDEIMEMPNDS